MPVPAPLPEAPPAPETPAIRSLFDAFSSIKDPRNPSGLRHPLPALLGLLVVSYCTGGTTVKDAVLFARGRKALRKQIGFTHPTCPSQSTYTRLLKVLPLEDVTKALSDWLLGLVLRHAGRKNSLCASIDGKALRGSGVHAINVFVQDLWLLLDQHEVDTKANEMSAFRARLDGFMERYPFLRMLTFDAMFCEQKTMDIIAAHGRMAVIQVKENQPEGLLRIQRLFSPLPAAPDTEGTEKKWGLHRDPQVLGAASEPRHC